MTPERRAEIEAALKLSLRYDTRIVGFWRDTAAELLAEVRRLEKERDGWKSSYHNLLDCREGGFHTCNAGKRADQAEAQVAELEAQLDSHFDDGFEHGVNWRSAGNYKNPREAAANHRKRVGGAE